MKSSDLNLLSSAITKVNDWKTSADAAGVTLTEVVMVFPDGSQVRFVWDNTEAQYIISL